MTPSSPVSPARPVVDNLHGHEIVDPYRWLEHAGSPETQAWIAAQNSYTQSILDSVPGRSHLRRHLTDLLSIGVVTAPVERGGRLFFTRREGQQNQPVLYVLEAGEGTERVLLDPNKESAEGLVVLDWWYPSCDGTLLAYGYSRAGDEWSTLHILEVDTGTVRPERIQRARHSSIAWVPDCTGLYYTRYPYPGEVPAGEENYHVRMFFHRLGEDPANDTLVFGEDLGAQEIPSVQLSADGRWLVITVHEGWERSDLYLRDRTSEEAALVPVAVGYDALFFPHVAGDAIYLHTNLDAPCYRVFRIDPQHPSRADWEQIIAEPADAVLESVTPVGGRLVAGFMRNAVSSLAVFDADGVHATDVAVPPLGRVTEVTGEWESSDAYCAFESFTIPPTVFRIEMPGGAVSGWSRVDAPIKPDDYAVSQEWYRSKDSTPVSMFVVHRRDLDVSHPRPTLLTGYGGFNLPRTPAFTRGLFLWLDRGGIFALPNLRGGSEYGEEWHRAGMLDRKQNVFDDFISAAEYLVARGYTDSSHLVISGRSNGGLLVGAALTQRPDLFRAVVCGVPLLDMLRYHHFLLARLWIPEYGSADDPAQFPYLQAYSPYHRVEDGVRYPAVLLITAEADSRVDPMHARKMAARLQAASSGGPVLLRVESKAGHGIGKPLAKLVEDETDFWTFLFWQVGMDP